MNKHLKLYLIILINFLLFTGCAGLDIIAQDTPGAKVEKKDTLTGGDQADDLKNRQDLKPLLISIMQLNYFDMSFNQFESFVLEGDPLFGDLIFHIFAGKYIPNSNGPLWRSTQTVPNGGRSIIPYRITRSFTKSWCPDMGFPL